MTENLSLLQLLGGITKENLHSEQDWGAASDREIWMTNEEKSS